MFLCNDGKRKERIALSTLFCLLIVPQVLSISVNVLFSLGYPAGASPIERELLISMKLEFPKEFPPPPSFIFWLSFHFLHSQNQESHSSVYICSETARKHLLRRLIIDSCIFKVTEKIASQITRGFVIDDPTRLQDVEEAAKKFFNEISNINCCGDWTPKCCPLFSINNHVLDWLSKPEKERYY